jgi:hypothetical protein
LPFDISTGPIDRVRAELAVERKPVLGHLRMNAPEAAQQIVSGIYQLEENRWRWMGGKAVMLLKSPSDAAPLEAVFSIPGAAPARRMTVSLDGVEVASQGYAGPGAYTLVTAPLKPVRESATVTLSVDRTFAVPGDRRRLGVVLAAVGFVEKGDRGIH